MFSMVPDVHAVRMISVPSFGHPCRRAPGLAAKGTGHRSACRPAPAGRSCSHMPMGEAPPGALPALHSAWLDGLTGITDLQAEPRATCGDCVMCAGPERSGSRLRFSPEIKCCSYIPHIANFLAGRSLRGSGRDSMRARMLARTGVTPLGLGLSHADVDRMVRAQPRFGRTGGVRCPHYQVETSGCAIWEDRNAVCATWFCKHERGAVSQHLWHAVRDLLIAAEERIAYRCLTGGVIPLQQLDDVLAYRAGVRERITLASAPPGAPPTGSLSPPDDELPGWYERMWGDWLGREEEWFLHCAGQVDAMGPDDVADWMDGVPHLAATVTEARARLDEPGPAGESLDSQHPLRFTPGVGSEVDGDVLRLVGYSAFDPLTLPAGVLPALEQLGGGRVPAQRAGSDLEPELLRRLADYGLLTRSGGRDLRG